MHSMDHSGGEDRYLINSGGAKGSRTFYILVAIFVIWNILLFSLAISGVAIARNNANDDSNESADPCVTSKIQLYDSSEVVPIGSAVSLSSQGGSVRLGGGTSIYKLDLISETIPSLVDFVLVEVNGTFSVLAFTDTEGYLWTSLGSQHGSDITWSNPANSGFKASNLASGARINTNLVVISSNKGIISIEPLPTPKVYQPQTNAAASTNTQLCALDRNMFAVSYPEGPLLVSLVATVTEGASTIAWSNNSISFPYDTTAHSLACFAPLHYIVNVVEDSKISSEVVLYSYVNGTVTATLSTTMEDVTALSFIRSIALKRTLAVGGILYIDANTNALTLTTFNLAVDQIQYGSSLTINNGGPLDQGPSSKIADITTLGIETGFVVSYSDWSNEEKLTIFIGEITDANSIAAAAPTYVLSPPNEDVMGETYWNSVVGISDTTFVTVYSLMNSTSSVNTASSIGHVFNSPIGIVMDTAKVDGVPGVVVGISGQCKVNSAEVEAGYYYYSDSVGSLFMPDPTLTTLDEYIDLGNILLSKNSLVGIGISSEDLLIKSSPF